MDNAIGPPPAEIVGSIRNALANVPLEKTADFPFNGSAVWEHRIRVIHPRAQCVNESRFDRGPLVRYGKITFADTIPPVT
jgi:hypothetical protein